MSGKQDAGTSSQRELWLLEVYYITTAAYGGRAGRTSLPFTEVSPDAYVLLYVQNVIH